MTASRVGTQLSQAKRYIQAYIDIYGRTYLFLMKTVLPINGAKHPRFIKKVDEAELNL